MINANGLKKNSNVRKIVISNFRNVGITYDKDDKPAELIINRSIEPDDIGDLVFLVGPNNSGKSNALSAIEVLSTGKLEPHDTPDFMYSDKQPMISMQIIKGDKKSIRDLSFVKKDNAERLNIESEIKRLEEEYNLMEKDVLYLRSQSLELNSEILSFDKVIFTDDEMLFLKDSRNYGSNSLYDYSDEKLNKINLKGYGNKDQDSIKKLIKNRMQDRELSVKKQKLKDTSKKLKDINDRQKEIDLELMKKRDKFKEKSDPSNQNVVTNKLNSKELNDYEYLLTSKVVRYRQNSISQTDLSCKPENVTDFVRNILLIMGRKSDALENIYAKYEAKNQKAYLKKFAEELNKELPGKITDRFNDMYFCNEGEKYRFDFDLDSDRVYVSVYRGDVPLDLDKQSTGFRWFFDFFFNFVHKEDLKPGDIIIMDEPATNIHVSGQLELRKYLKQLSKKMRITFIISTHSPFLVSCDYLDELRLMTRDDRGHVQIEDKFDIVSDNADKLDPVLNGLTIGRHILIGPKQKVIFTEGITDYDYLTAFKILFSADDPKYERLAFLPVGGVKNDKLLDILSSIDDSPTLLVDSDEAGNRIKEKAKDTRVSVVSLSDIDEVKQYKTIEGLFTLEDRNKFNLYDKEWNSAAIFKRNIHENSTSLSDTTKKRFKDTLDKLLDV